MNNISKYLKTEDNNKINAFSNSKINTSKKELKFSVLSLILFLSLMIFSIFFMFNFQVAPSNLQTILIFIISTIIYISFLISIERLLYIKEKNLVRENKSIKAKFHNKNFDKKKRDLSVFSKFFGVIENFPYEDRFTGKKKTIIKYFGWFILIFSFFISVIIKEAVFEFRGAGINIRHWVQYFGFNIFVCLIGCFILFLFSRARLSGVLKLSIVGVAILIQVEVMIDYFFFPWRLPYDDILWNDFFKAFSSFLLDPDLTYSTGVGHPFLMGILILLSFLYIFIKSKDSIHITSRKKWVYILIRGLIGGFNFYLMTIYAGVMLPLCKDFLSNFESTGPCFINLSYSLLFIIYLSPLFLLILYKIIYDEREKQNLRVNSFKKIMNEINSNINKKINSVEKIKSHYKSKYLIKMLIFIILLIFGIILLFLTIWAYPLVVL